MANPTKDVRAVLKGYDIHLIHQPTGEVIQRLQLNDARPEHRSFIISTWLKSYRNQARKQGIQEYYDAHEPAIAESYWKKCAVATDEDGYTVYAWVCGDALGLRHVYVIPELRMLGMSGALTKFSCGTVRDLARPWPYRTTARINPYLLGVPNA